MSHLSWPIGNGTGCVLAREPKGRWSLNSPPFGSGNTPQKAGSSLLALVRRSLEAVPEIKYYLSNGKPETPLGVMARVRARGARSKIIWKIVSHTGNGALRDQVMERMRAIT